MKTKHSLMKKIITWMTHDFFIMVVPESLICLDWAVKLPNVLQESPAGSANFPASFAYLNPGQQWL